MQQAVKQYPFMVEADFLARVAQVIAEQVPVEYKGVFEERLGWLQTIAQQQIVEGTDN